MPLLNGTTIQQLDSMTYNVIAGVLPDGTNARYMSDVTDVLPTNCILNKVTTGCGLTSLALSNAVKTVVVVPYLSLEICTNYLGIFL